LRSLNEVEVTGGRGNEFAYLHFVSCLESNITFMLMRSKLYPVVIIDMLPVDSKNVCLKCVKSKVAELLLIRVLQNTLKYQFLIIEHYFTKCETSFSINTLNSMITEKTLLQNNL
jgi:hypothetical protein